MAFINAEGKAISYECSELIEELKQDIAEFGGETVVDVLCKDTEGVVLYTDYKFIEDDEHGFDCPMDNEGNEFVNRMTMSALLVAMEKQNEIL